MTHSKISNRLACRVSRFERTRIGFTIVELLVVIAIIVLLASMLLPSLQKARELAKNMSCRINLRSLGIKFMFYTEDSGGFIPYPYNVNASDWYQWYSPPGNWIAVLTQAGYGERLKWNNSEKLSNPTLVTCPSDDSEASPLCYGMNDGWTNEAESSLMPTTPQPMYSDLISLPDIRNPSNTVLLADVRRNWAWYTWRWYIWGSGGSYSFRHDDGSNFLFVDGHVEYSHPDPGQLELNICRPQRFKYTYLD